MFTKWSFPTSTADPKRIYNWLSLESELTLYSSTVTLNHDQIFWGVLHWAQSMSDPLGLIFLGGYLDFK